MNLKDFKPSVRKRIEKAFESKYGKVPKESKYHNVKTEVDGIVFDSNKEAVRWKTLQMLQRAGRITELKRQIGFVLIVNGEKICVYKADFTYREKGVYTVEDAKGVRTAEYKLKKKLVRAIFGIVIKET